MGAVHLLWWEDSFFLKGKKENSVRSCVDFSHYLIERLKGKVPKVKYSLSETVSAIEEIHKMYFKYLNNPILLFFYFTI